MLYGADIYEPSPWPTGRLEFIVIKATQGRRYTNANLRAQLTRARSLGLCVGFYHFPEFRDNPADDAQHFASVVGPLLRPGDVIVLDHEWDASVELQPSPAHASMWGRMFLSDAQQALKRRPWVYANLAWASGGYCDGMGGYPYWCADPSSPAGKPRLRGPFTSWVAHQYAIVGTDRDVFNGDAAAWRALGQPLQPHQEEDDMAQRDLKDGLNQRTGLILIPRSDGKRHTTTFEAFCDNTLDDGAQVHPFAPVTLRVAIHKSNGYWQVVPKFVVGRGPKDTNQKQYLIQLDDPKSTAINVTRVTGSGDEPITITAY